MDITRLTKHNEFQKNNEGPSERDKARKLAKAFRTQSKQFYATELLFWPGAT